MAKTWIERFKRTPVALGHAEVEHLGEDLLLVGDEEDVGRLEVAVDDSG